MGFLRLGGWKLDWSILVLFLKIKTQKDSDGVKNDSTITKTQITKWSFDITYLLLLEKYSGNLISYYYFSLWTNHGVFPLINGVYLHMLVIFTQKTGNCKLKLSRILLQTVLVSKSQTLRKANFLPYRLYRKVTLSIKEWHHIFRTKDLNPYLTQSLPWSWKILNGDCSRNCRP